MLKRYRSAAIAVSALLVTSSLVYAAGKFSTLPIVGGSSFCASTVTGTGGLSGVTGQGQGTLGSICGETVPAGPSIVSGLEVVPADLYRPDQTPASLGAQPQTALLTMASLNALPITYTSVVSSATSTLTAAATSGGFLVDSTATITNVTVKLPAAPIDGQQFALSSDQTITTLTMTSPTSGVTINNSPTVLTKSTTAAFGYRFLYNAANTVWNRLQ